ncbi:hypothetical protein [Paenibacillus sp. Soil766]|uniref:hypothetical protein n=1 Tax=Paenibacillus sp. Soil766 TaxID=1736404 RepID=UPI0012FB58F2|nr:hypothetical protein [Paenibacillus sp. Soil766]
MSRVLAPPSVRIPHAALPTHPAGPLSTAKFTSIAADAPAKNQLASAQWDANWFIYYTL